MDVDGPASVTAPLAAPVNIAAGQPLPSGSVRDRPPTPYPMGGPDDSEWPSRTRLPSFRRRTNTATPASDETMLDRTTRENPLATNHVHGTGRQAVGSRFSENWTLAGTGEHPQRSNGPPAARGAHAAAAPVPGSGILHDSTPSISVTRAPRDGWPRVEQRSFTSWRSGQSGRQAEAWRQEEGPLMVIQFAGHGTQDLGSERRIAAVQEVLRTNYGIDTDQTRFVAAIPQAANHHRDNSLPTYTAIFGLGSDNGERLVRAGWISTPTVTFRVESVNTTPPTFLGAFTQARRFGSLRPSDIAERVRETIRDDAELMWEIYEIIARDVNTQGRWAGREPDIVLEHLIETIRVDVV